MHLPGSDHIMHSLRLGLYMYILSCTVLSRWNLIVKSPQQPICWVLCKAFPVVEKGEKRVKRVFYCLNYSPLLMSSLLDNALPSLWKVKEEKRKNQQTTTFVSFWFIRCVSNPLRHHIFLWTIYIHENIKIDIDVYVNAYVFVCACVCTYSICVYF